MVSFSSLVLLASVSFFFEKGESTTGIDLSSSCDEFSCMHTNGIDFTITRAWKSYGAFDSDSLTNLASAKSAGIEYNDVYMFPCRGESASTQMKDLISDLKASGLWGPVSKEELNKINADEKNRRERNERREKMHSNKNSKVGFRAGYTIPKNKNKETYNINNSTSKKYDNLKPEWRNEASYGMIWLDIESNPSSGCSWSSYSSDSNCDYLGELITAGKDDGATIGIYSSEGEWENVMGSRTSCTDYTKYALWYAHYDNSASFSDFDDVSFGGWTKPSIKQYQGDTTFCSTGVDMDWY